MIDGTEVVEALSKQIGSWPGVEVADHRFGDVEFRAGRREIGHIHALPNGRSFADLPFPKKVRNVLIDAGRAHRHHVLPDSGWVTVPVATQNDLDDVIELFRMNFQRTWPS